MYHKYLWCQILLYVMFASFSFSVIQTIKRSLDTHYNKCSLSYTITYFYLFSSQPNLCYSSVQKVDNPYNSVWRLTSSGCFTLYYLFSKLISSPKYHVTTRNVYHKGRFNSLREVKRMKYYIHVVLHIQISLTFVLYSFLHKLKLSVARNNEGRYFT